MRGRFVAIVNFKMVSETPVGYYPSVPFMIVCYFSSWSVPPAYEPDTCTCLTVDLEQYTCKFMYMLVSVSSNHLVMMMF